MISINLLREHINIKHIIKYIKYNIKFRKEHPYFFDPCGLTIFIGSQGSGKTLSAVNYVYNLAKVYPKSIIVTNIDLKNYPIDDKRVFRFETGDDLAKYSNGEYGTIFLIDEIQLYFNSLDSKNINPEVMTQIAQQRKQRKHIIATSQVFGRMAKPLREQFDTVILCKSFFYFFQLNKLVDRDSLKSDDSTGTNIKGTVKKVIFYTKSPEMFSRYDTYCVIKSPKIKKTISSFDIYGKEQN